MQSLPDKPISFSLNRYVNTLDYYDLPEVIATNNSLYQYENHGNPRARLIIYPKDVKMILGHSEQYARQLLLVIRLSLQLTPREPVTITSFIQYTRLDPQTVVEFLRES